MESKIPCPAHGQRHIKVRQYSGGHKTPVGEWHRCTRCDFQRWIQLNLFILIIGAVSIGLYMENALIYLRLLS